MSKEHYDSKLAVFEAIPSNEVKSPNIPVDRALQEAEDLYAWCQADKELLEKAGLDWALVEDVPVRAGACRYIQSQWRKEYQSHEEAEKEWLEKSPAAYALRDELLHHFFFAYEKTPDIYSHVQEIAEGSGHADMIQDLSDLAALGKANTEQLTSIALDLSLLDEAETNSDAMAALLAKSNGAKTGDNKLCLLRDKAYAHLKEAVDEIRRCGQYVFWRDPQRKKGYVSKYLKSKRKSNGKDEEQSIEETKE